MLTFILLAGHGLFCTPVLAGASKKVVFIRANLKPDPGSAMVDKFKATMGQRGYVEGKNIDYVDIPVQGAEPEAEQEALATVDRYRDSTDLFVTAGMITSRVRARLAASTIPQLFAPVPKEEALTMLPSLTGPPGTNLSGVYLSYPPEKILRLTRLLLPGIQNYAYVFDSGIATDRIMKEAFAKLREPDRHGLTLHYLDVAQGTAQVVREMKTLRIEAFGGIIGAYKNRQELAASGLPMVTALIMDIEATAVAKRIRESNILAGLFDPFDYCGEQAAEMAADILSGKKSIAATVPRPARLTSFVNMAAASRLRVPIPFAVLEAVDIVAK